MPYFCGLSCTRRELQFVTEQPTTRGFGLDIGLLNQKALVDFDDVVNLTQLRYFRPRLCKNQTRVESI